MTGNDDSESFGFYLLLLIVIAIAVTLMLLLSFTIGALFGGGYAVYNYGAAFKKNVRPERV